MNKPSKNRQKKEQIVAKLAEKVNKAKGLVFTNYQGLTHKQLEGLKKAVRPLQADLVITKNTLLKLALSKSQFSQPKAGQPLAETFSFQNATATLLLYGDPVDPLRQLAKTIKELNLPSIKFGILDKQVLSDAEVLKLATLPSREILIMQLFWQMQAPIYGLHRALGWNMQKLVMTLKAIEAKKA